VIWARVFTFYYFAHFLFVMPIVGIIETPSQMPRSITEAVLGKGGGGAGAREAVATAPEKR
jgi:ubiquinol-cytochrome c reductase cytochrome b subunit